MHAHARAVSSRARLSRTGTTRRRRCASSRRPAGARPGRSPTRATQITVNLESPFTARPDLRSRNHHDLGANHHAPRANSNACRNRLARWCAHHEEAGNAQRRAGSARPGRRASSRSSFRCSSHWAPVVVGGGNWFVHAKHLQTKVDASALAAGSAWSFPCTAGSDAPIMTAARDYAGPHTDAGGTVHTGGYNEQVGDVPGDDVQVRLNANNWFDDDAGINPADFTTPSGGVCVAKELDVKATEVNSFPLASILPLFPDLKRKARVQIQESAETSGPGTTPSGRARAEAAQRCRHLRRRDTRRELRADSLGRVLQRRVRAAGQLELHYRHAVGARPLDDRQRLGRQPGDHHLDAGSQVGVVVALSHRPKCGSGTACFAINQPTIDQLCNQGTTAIAQCYYTTGTSTQTFQSGLQFIRGWCTRTPTPAPGPAEHVDRAADQRQLLLPGLLQRAGGQRLHGHAARDDRSGIRRRRAHTRSDTSTCQEMTSWLSDDPPGACNNNFGAGCQLTHQAAPPPCNSTRPMLAMPSQSRSTAATSRLRPLHANGLPGACANAPNQTCSWYYTARQKHDRPVRNRRRDRSSTTRSSEPSWATSFARARSSTSI